MSCIFIRAQDIAYPWQEWARANGIMDRHSSAKHIADGWDDILIAASKVLDEK